MEYKAEGWDLGPLDFILGSGSALGAHRQVNICLRYLYLASSTLSGSYLGQQTARDSKMVVMLLPAQPLQES